MGRLSNLQSGVDEVLTQYARGYSNRAFVYKHFFPEVSVTKVQNRVPVFSKENLRTYNTRRSLRTEGGIIQPDDIQFVRFETESRRLTYPIDQEEYDNSDYNLDQRAARVVTDALDLERELFAANFLLSPTSLPSAQSVVPSVKWDVASTPVIEAIKDAMNDFRNRTGVYPNRGIISADVLVALDGNTDIRDRVKFTQKFTPTVDLLASLCTIDKQDPMDIVVGSGIHNVVAGVWDEDREVFVGEVNNDIWKGCFAMAYVTSNPSVFEPSCGYTFTERGYPYMEKNLHKDTETVKVVRRDKTTIKATGKDAFHVFRNVLTA